MLRNPRHRRLLGWLLVLACIGAGGWMVLDAFRNQLVFFYSPSEWKMHQQAGVLPKGATMRLGGLVKSWIAVLWSRAARAAWAFL